LSFIALQLISSTLMLMLAKYLMLSLQCL